MTRRRGATASAIDDYHDTNFSPHEKSGPGISAKKQPRTAKPTQTPRKDAMSKNNLTRQASPAGGAVIITAMLAPIAVEALATVLLGPPV